MIRLFDDKERLKAGPALHNGDTYTAYNDSADPDMTLLRDLLSNWFDLYPDSEKADLKALFKVKLHHAFFELFIYRLFTALGYQLTVHPDLPGTDKHPDFLAVKGEQRFYLEAKFMDMQSREEQAKERRQNALLDALNTVDARNFLLCIQTITFKDGSQPNGKKIIRFFNEQLAGHEPEVYRAELEATGFTHMPAVIFDDEQVTIKVKLMPKAEQLRGTDSRAIASLPAGFKIGNDSERIREALETKATRYGRPDLPFIICLNKQSVRFDVHEMQEALYGNHSGPGFFGTKDNPRFTRVSGVYMTNANTANLVSTAVHVFGPNLQASLPVDFALTACIADILQIPDNYHNRKLPVIRFA
jgi:hypothetical protein